MRKTLILAMATIMTLSGCGMSIDAATPNGTYATQTRDTAVEYSLYVNKQITVFSSQLSTRMIAVANTSDSYYSAEAEMAEDGKTLMQQARDEFETTYPSKGMDEHRETVLDAMDIALSDMDDYISALKAGSDISDYADIFQNDFNTLTGLASLYTQ